MYRIFYYDCPQSSKKIYHPLLKRTVDLGKTEISGDSDFVPASKLAQRQGIDFILDSLGEKVKDDLSLHIDGLKTHIDSIKPTNKTQLLTTDL